MLTDANLGNSREGCVGKVARASLKWFVLLGQVDTTPGINSALEL